MRGVQLSINTIVVVALALLVLVTIGAFFVTGQARLGSTFSRFIGGQTATADLQAAIIECQQLCNVLEGRDFDSVSVVAQQPFCTRVFSLKEDGDPNDQDRCTDPIIGVSCEVRVSGQLTRVDNTLCTQGAGVGVVVGG